jgi:hypothetical protein
MLNIINVFLDSLTLGQLFMLYFWGLALPACGVAWLIEEGCKRLFRNSKDSWRNL